VASKYLGIYLNDHMAGSALGVRVARRGARDYAGTELGTFLGRMADEIEEDREVLRQVMAAAGTSPQLHKLVAGVVGEQLSRVKMELNGRILGTSPLTPFMELETLKLGIHGKELLWRVLREVPADVGLTPGRLDELIARAERQQAEVEAHRLAAGHRAFVDGG
jgi:hypothetical protein